MCTAASKGHLSTTVKLGGEAVGVKRPIANYKVDLLHYIVTGMEKMDNLDIFRNMVNLSKEY